MISKYLFYIGYGLLLILSIPSLILIYPTSGTNPLKFVWQEFREIEEAYQQCRWDGMSEMGRAIESYFNSKENGEQK
jgi:hypothetical protein